jgi:hypothetical protein
MQELFNSIVQTIVHFTTKFYFLYILVFLAYLIVVFRKRIDYFFMKKDPVWCKWFKSAYRCPACLKRLRPYDYPPNYICHKCGNTYAFGDKTAKMWIKNKPMLTKGEFFRYSVFLVFLASGAIWLFSSGVLNR